MGFRTILTLQTLQNYIRISTYNHLSATIRTLSSYFLQFRFIRKSSFRSQISLFPPSFSPFHLNWHTLAHSIWPYFLRTNVPCSLSLDHRFTVAAEFGGNSACFYPWLLEESRSISVRQRHSTPLSVCWILDQWSTRHHYSRAWSLIMTYVLILAMTETWVKSIVPSVIINGPAPPVYRILHVHLDIPDQNIHRGGGLAVIHRCTINIQPRKHKINNSSFELQPVGQYNPSISWHCVGKHLPRIFFQQIIVLWGVRLAPYQSGKGDGWSSYYNIITIILIIL